MLVDRSVSSVWVDLALLQIQSTYNILQHQTNLFKSISAILHMGNVDFSEDDSEKASVKNKRELAIVAVRCTCITLMFGFLLVERLRQLVL